MKKEEIYIGLTDSGSINKELRREMATAWEETSEAVVNTQRASLIAIIFEFGLIDKENKGINVVYKITELGNKFL